jgi:hypothetical protein
MYNVVHGAVILLSAYHSRCVCVKFWRGEDDSLLSCRSFVPRGTASMTLYIEAGGTFVSLIPMALLPPGSDCKGTWSCSNFDLARFISAGDAKFVSLYKPSQALLSVLA